MGNVFDQFDTAPAPAPQSSASGNVFDQFDPPPTPRPQSRPGTMLENVAAGANEAAYNLAGLPVDLATGLHNVAARGINAVAGTNLPMTDAADVPMSSDWIKSQLGKVGLDPRQVTGHPYLKAAGEGAASMVLPAGIANALPEMSGVAGAVQRAFGVGSPADQALVGMASGAGGKAAEDAAPAPLKPYANLLGQVAGGGAAAVGEAGARFAGTQLRNAARDFSAPMRASGQQDLAAARVQSAATDPQAAAARLDQPENVPGSQLTSYQMSGDQGLGAVEATAQTRDADKFLTRRNEQNAARVNALNDPRFAPDVADPQSVVRAVRQAFNGMDDANALAEFHAQNDLERLKATPPVEQTSALNAAKAEAERLGELPPGEDAAATMLQQHGEAVRQPAAAAMAQSKDTERAFWNAVDPDGTLALHTAPIKAKAAEIAGQVTPEATPMDGVTARIFKVAQDLPDVLPFQRFKDLRTQITNALPELRMSNAPDSKANVRRLSDLLAGLHDALDGAVAGHAMEEAAAVKAGAVEPADTMAGRLQAWADDIRQQDAGSRGASAAGNVPQTSARAGSGNAGTAGAPRSGFSSVAGIARGSADQGAAPQSLSAFLISKGGLKEQGGELRAMGALRGRPGLVNNKTGLLHDYAREAANEAGYGPFSDVREFLEAIGEEAAGRRQYRPEQSALELSADEARRSNAAYQSARNRVLQAEDDFGLRLTPAEIEHATIMHRDGMEPGEAVRRAVIASEYETLDQQAARNAFDPQSGLPLGAQQSEMPIGGNGLRANWDQAASDRYAAARAYTRQHNETFTDPKYAPGVAQILKSGKWAGDFDMLPSQVPSTILTGKGAPERIQAYLRAGGSRQALLDYAAFDLRKAATDADGTINPTKARAWIQGHERSGAADALPELRTLGHDAVSARQAFDEATVRAADAQKAQVAAAKDQFQRAAKQRKDDARAFQQSAAGKFLGEGDPVALMGQVLRSNTAVADVRRLMALTAGSTSARMGLRRAAIESIIRDVKSVQLAGDQPLIKSGEYQKILQRADPALRELFPPAQVEALHAIARDLQSASLSISGNRLPGRSNTAQDLTSLAKNAIKTPSVLAQLAISESAGWLTGMPVAGTALGFGALALNVMRKAGFQKVDDLITEAALNPPVMKALLLRPLPTGETRALQVLRQRLQQIVPAATAGTIGQRKAS